MIKPLHFIVFLCFFCFSNAFSHGDIDKRIVAVSEEIKKHSDSAQLYFKRGKLYYQHEDYKLSIKDINRSIKLGYLDIEQGLLLSKNYFELKNHRKALRFVDDILMQSPNDVVFLKIKAHILFQNQDYTSAAIYYEQVIDNSSKTFPENYIVASKAWYLSGDAIGFNNSISILNKGIDELGQIISLLEAKVERYLVAGFIDESIESQKNIVDMLQRKEHAYFRLGELYIQSNNYEVALNALNDSEKCINILPERIKNTSNIKNLIEDIKVNKELITSKLSEKLYQN